MTRKGHDQEMPLPGRAKNIQITCRLMQKKHNRAYFVVRHPPWLQICIKITKRNDSSENLQVTNQNAP